jgi:predicted CopG family antitoxin
MPFGVKNAVEFFQRTMDTILLPLGQKSYLDDIMVCASTPEECRNKTEEVIETLTRKGFMLNEEKCRLTPATDFHFLGVHIKNGWPVMSKQDKEKLMSQCRTIRKTKRNPVERIRGKILYYRTAWPRLYDIQRELLTRNIKDPEWDHILQVDNTFFSKNKARRMESDASATDVAVVARDSNNNIVWEATKALSKPQQSWTNPRREGYAASYAIDQWRKKEGSRPGTLVVDNRAIGTENYHGIRLELEEKIKNLGLRLHITWSPLEKTRVDDLSRRKGGKKSFEELIEETVQGREPAEEVQQSERQRQLFEESIEEAIANKYRNEGTNNETTWNEIPVKRSLEDQIEEAVRNRHADDDVIMTDAPVNETGIEELVENGNHEENGQTDVMDL